MKMNRSPTPWGGRKRMAWWLRREQLSPEDKKELQGNETKNSLCFGPLVRAVANNLDMIGEGGFGRVFRTNFQVVIKTIPESWALLRELAVYQLIERCYPNPESHGLPRLLGFGPNYLAFPPYQKVEAGDHLIPLMKAVHSLHRIGIVHRDLKKSNLMMGPQGLVAIDFGMSCWWPFDRFRGRETSIQSFWYRAPEVALDSDRESNHTPAIDLWSLGVVWEYLRTGHHLYKPETSGQLVGWLCRLFNLRDWRELQKAVAFGHLQYKDNAFLRLNPDDRPDLRAMLNFPPDPPLDQICPIAEVKTPLPRQLFWTLLDKCSDLLMAVIAISAYESGTSLENALAIGAFLTGKSVEYTFPPDFAQTCPPLYQMTTLHLLMLSHPARVIRKHGWMVLIFAYGGNKDHRRQASWISKRLQNQWSDDTEMSILYYSNLERLDRRLDLLQELASANVIG